MTDLTTSGASGGLGLAYRIGREVVLVHITLGGLFIKTIQLLCIADRTQGSNGQDLCLASGKQTGTVYSRYQPNLSSQRTDLINAAPVYTLAVVEPVTDNLLLELVQALIQLCRAGLAVLFVQCLMNLVSDGLHTCITNVLIIGIQCDLDLFAYQSLDLVKHFVRDLLRLELELLLTDLLLDVCNE